MTVGIYVSCAALWIALSDRFAAYVIGDAARLAQVELYKGLFFVAITGGLLALLLRRLLRTVASHQREGKRASLEQAFSHSVIESVPGVLYLYDEAGHFLRWNRNFERVSGYGHEEIRTMSPLDFFAPDERSTVGDRIAEVFDGGASSVEADLVAKDGARTPYFFTGKRLLLDGVKCLVGVGIDVTERRRAELALRDLNESLEQKVSQRTVALDAAKVRAESADRVKSAFLATMSHELRTPLNSILGFTGIILQGLAGPLNAEQELQLGMVQTSARHLLDLINDVLDISKIEAGQLEVRIAPFDVSASVQRVVASLAPAASKKDLSLRVELPESLGAMRSDRRRVEQILLNLIHNAIKFTDRGEVVLAIEAVGTELHIRVEDTGIGIQPADLALLFQPFRQIESGLQRRHEGTGLGLAISHRLIEILGGTVKVESQWGVGSRFLVTLPSDAPVTPEDG